MRTQRRRQSTCVLCASVRSPRRTSTVSHRALPCNCRFTATTLCALTHIRTKKRERRCRPVDRLIGASRDRRCSHTMPSRPASDHRRCHAVTVLRAHDSGVQRCNSASPAAPMASPYIWCGPAHPRHPASVGPRVSRALDPGSHAKANLLGRRSRAGPLANLLRLDRFGDAISCRRTSLSIIVRVELQPRRWPNKKRPGWRSPLPGPLLQVFVLREGENK